MTSRRYATFSVVYCSAGRHQKPAKVLSGGEKGRMLFGKLMMQKPEHSDHGRTDQPLDMESIESLNMALELYQGTLIFVSHDREFVSYGDPYSGNHPERVIDFAGITKITCVVKGSVSYYQ